MADVSIKLENQLQDCINSLTTSSTCCVFLLNAASTDGTFKNNRSSTVTSSCNLPDLFTENISAGTIVLLENENVPVLSTGCEWYGLDGRLLRRDYFECSLFAWGGNSFASGGFLGDGTKTNRCSPVREITSSTTWSILSAGSGHTAAIKSDGSLWTWGCNDIGQLGINVADFGTCTCSPVREITSSTNWMAASAGSGTTTAIKTDGSLWGWGDNFTGNLGIGTSGVGTCKCSPVREITSSTNWCKVSRQNALKTDGSLWSWGPSNCGILGDGTTVSKCSPVREITSSTNWCTVCSTGSQVSAIKIDGTLWSWGYNCVGTLGDGTTVDRCSPVREISSSTNWATVSPGTAITAAIKNDYSIWSWGFNQEGGLGTGNTISFCSPVREVTCSLWASIAVGIRSTLAVKLDGTLWGWGINTCGNLGDGTTVSKCSPVREISSSTSWTLISTSQNFSLGLKTV